MKICKEERCSGCMCCMNICPQNAIKIIIDDQGFQRPEIDESICIRCGKCLSACPANNVSVVSKNQEITPKVYAAWIKDNNFRKKCTSGGIATELAKSIINQHGVVYGAAYIDGFKVQHICVDDQSKLSSLIGAKYVQSDIGESYREIKLKLQNGIKVLFVGTPCQVEGLYSYLKNGRCSTGNLLTIDILCHGVPSPQVFTEYINYIQEKYQKRIIKINQRGKKKSWLTYSTEITFEDGSKLVEYKEQNEYTAGFFNNIFLRPSCYECMYANTHRIGDITLGDFWGYIETNSNDKDTDEGISMVMINSIKGKDAFDAISDSVICFERSIDEAVAGNPTLSAPSKKGLDYDAFWRDKERMPFDELLKKYCKPSKIKWDEVARYVLIHNANCPGIIKRFLRFAYYKWNLLFRNTYER